MATNPLIPLQGRGPASFSSVFDVFQNALLSAQRQKEAPLRQRLLDAQATAAEQQVAPDAIQSAREQRRLQSVVTAASRINALDTTEQKLSFAKRRRKNLIDAGIDTSDTDAYIEAVESGDIEGSERLIQGAIKLGVERGLIKGPAATERFEAVTDAEGNVIAQRNVLTNKVFSDPRAVEVGAGLTNVKEAAGGGFIGIDDNGESVFIPAPENKLTTGQAKSLEISPEKEADIFKREQGLRKEFSNLSKDFIAVRDAHTRVLRSAKDPSAAGDLALIFNYMKVLDPGSVVRESEFATAEGAQAAIGDLEEQGSVVPNFVKRRVAKLVEGTRLLPEQRQDFVDRSQALFEGQLRNQSELADAFNEISVRSKVNPENVVIDFTLEDQPQKKDTGLTKEQVLSMTPAQRKELLQKLKGAE